VPAGSKENEFRGMASPFPLALIYASFKVQISRKASFFSSSQSRLLTRVASRGEKNRSATDRFTRRPKSSISTPISWSRQRAQTTAPLQWERLNLRPLAWGGKPESLDNAGFPWSLAVKVNSSGPRPVYSEIRYRIKALAVRLKSPPFLSRYLSTFWVSSGLSTER